jgi:hypothetical protein
VHRSTMESPAVCNCFSSCTHTELALSSGSRCSAVLRRHDGRLLPRQSSVHQHEPRGRKVFQIAGLAL